MKLIVGLGNPGTEYDRTRHNVGFEVVDSLARRFAAAEVARAKFHSLLIDANIAGEKILLSKPTTYMNQSGTAISEIARFYKLQPESDLLVIVDDVALECGIIRLRGEGSSGGHNGLADIEQRIGTREYARIRIGVGQPGTIPQKDYVLGRFRPEQRDAIETALDDSVGAAVCWARDGITEAMNRYNRKQSATNTNTATP